MKKTKAAEFKSSWQYEQERKQEKRQHKKQRASRKNRNNVWQSVGE